MNTKRCKRCGVEQPVTDFPYYDSGVGTGYRNFCGPCLSTKNKEYRDSNQARVYALSRNRILKRRYGILSADYARMFESQGGLCAICRTDTPTQTGKRLLNGEPHPFHVDHDHVTGVVRGLLCPSCNKALGLLGEHNLPAAVAYLNRHNQENDISLLDS